MSNLKKIPLNITAAEGIVQSEKIEAFTAWLYLNIQFFYTLAGGETPANAYILQSFDGVNFDYMFDLENEKVFIELPAGNNTATLNLVAFFSSIIKLEFEFPAGISGSVSHILIIAR